MGRKSKCGCCFSNVSKTRGDGRGWGPEWWSCRATTLPPAPSAQVLSPKVLSPCRLALSHAVSWALLMQKQHPGRQEFTHIILPWPREPPGAAGYPSAPLPPRASSSPSPRQASKMHLRRQMGFCLQLESTLSCASSKR